MILMYHKVDLESPTLWWVNVNNFYRQMHEISSKHIVYLDDYNPEDDTHVVITFDGIYENVVDYALPILKHFDYPFELFLTSDYLGKDNAFDEVEPLTSFTGLEGLKKLVKGRGRLQWHTKSHINLQEVKDIDTIKNELLVPNELKLIDENGFNWFAYPHGEFNEVVLEEVKKTFKGALSCNQGNDRDKYKYNRITVTNSTKLSSSTVACIIASYNYGSFLIEAIESVLRQTILPDEILITDDCSDDDTQLIAESYVEKYPELIKYNRNTVNLGIVKNFNTAIKLTNSDFVFFLGADNRLLSNYVEDCRQVLESNNEIGIAYTDYALFDVRAKIIYDKFDLNWQGDIVDNTYYKIEFPEFENINQMLTELKIRNFIHGSSMFRRVAFNEVGGYVESNKPEDHNLFLRIVEYGWAARKAKHTNLEYRQHSVYQANNVVTLYGQLNFYKKQYNILLKRRTLFEKSKYYKVSYFFYRTFTFLKQNYLKPKKLFKYSMKYLKRIF